MSRHTLLLLITWLLVGCAASTEGAVPLSASERPLESSETLCAPPAGPVGVRQPSGICLNAPHWYWDGAGCVTTGPYECVNDLLPLAPRVAEYDDAESCEVAHAHCR